MLSFARLVVALSLPLAVLLAAGLITPGETQRVGLHLNEFLDQAKTGSSAGKQRFTLPDGGVDDLDTIEDEILAPARMGNWSRIWYRGLQWPAWSSFAEEVYLLVPFLMGYLTIKLISDLLLR